MTEVRKHQRQTASGRTTTVRHHTRNAGSRGGGEDDSHPPGTQYMQDGDATYAHHPDGTRHRVPGEPPRPSTAPVVGSEELRADPTPRDEDWWADDEPTAGELWADEDDGPTTPPRRGDRAFPAMQQQMRDWRTRDVAVPPAEPDTSPLGRALGIDTPEGAAKFARLKAYRDGGYDGPLDQDGQIPDPDDPANYESLHALAALSE
jgi:hypothetical protein